MSQLAKDTGFSRESLYRVLSAEGNPSFATVLKVAKALGIRLQAQAAVSGETKSLSAQPFVFAATKFWLNYLSLGRFQWVKKICTIVSIKEF